LGVVNSNQKLQLPPWRELGFRVNIHNSTVQTSTVFW